MVVTCGIHMIFLGIIIFIQQNNIPQKNIGGPHAM